MPARRSCLPKAEDVVKGPAITDGLNLSGGANLEMYVEHPNR